MFYDKNLVAQICALTRLTRLDRLRTAVEHLIREHDFQYFFLFSTAPFPLTGRNRCTFTTCPRNGAASTKNRT